MNDLATEIYHYNPVTRGIIDSIIQASSNINYQPYINGRQLKSYSFDFNINESLKSFLLTGNVLIERFEGKLIILNPIQLSQDYNGNLIYTTSKGERILKKESILIIKDDDIFTDNILGVSRFQSAIMPIEAMRSMFEANVSHLKNRGVNVIIGAGSNESINVEYEEFDKAINERLGGATKTGKIATTTADIKVHKLNDNFKDMALWDGFKIETRSICNALNYPSILANDTEGKTYSNYSEARKSLYVDCVIPIVSKITKAVQKDLGYEIFLDVSNIDVFQESYLTKAEKSKINTDAILLLNTKVKYGEITKEIAIEILVMDWGYDRNEAGKFIMTPKNNESQPIQDINI
jgi:hypothetical protein